MKPSLAHTLKTQEPSSQFEILIKEIDGMYFPQRENEDIFRFSYFYKYQGNWYFTTMDEHLRDLAEGMTQNCIDTLWRERMYGKRLRYILQLTTDPGSRRVTELTKFIRELQERHHAAIQWVQSNIKDYVWNIVNTGINANEETFRLQA